MSEAKENLRCEVHYWHMGDGRCSCPHDCKDCGVTYVGGHSKDECITVLKSRYRLNELATKIEALSAGREPMSREDLMAAAKADVLANLSKAPIIKDYDPPLVVSRMFSDGCEFKGEAKPADITSTPYEIVSHDEVLKVVCPLCHAGIGQACKYDTGEEYSGIHLRRHAKAYLSLRKQADVDECGSPSCWFNSETGYREYCPKHEAIIADKAIEVDARRKLVQAAQVKVQQEKEYWAGEIDFFEKRSTSSERADANENAVDIWRRRAWDMKRRLDAIEGGSAEWVRGR